MASRAHVYKVLQNADGSVLAGATIRVLGDGTSTEITDTLYTAETGSSALTQGFTSDSGLVEFWLSVPKRVVIGYTPPGGGSGEEFVTVDAYPRSEDILVPTNTPTAGDFLQSTDGTTAEWGAAPSGGGGGGGDVTVEAAGQVVFDLTGSTWAGSIDTGADEPEVSDIPDAGLSVDGSFNVTVPEGLYLVTATLEVDLAISSGEIWTVNGALFAGNINGPSDVSGSSVEHSDGTDGYYSAHVTGLHRSDGTATAEFDPSGFQLWDNTGTPVDLPGSSLFRIRYYFAKIGGGGGGGITPSTDVAVYSDDRTVSSSDVIPDFSLATEPISSGTSITRDADNSKLDIVAGTYSVTFTVTFPPTASDANKGTFRYVLLTSTSAGIQAPDQRAPIGGIVPDTITVGFTWTFAADDVLWFQAQHDALESIDVDCLVFVQRLY